MRWKVQFSQEVPVRNFNEDLNYVLVPGKEYLINGDFLKLIKNVYGSKIKDIEEMNWISTVPLEKSKNLLIYRTGGIGDLLFILPYLSSVKKLNPEIKITFATMSINFEILKLSKYIDNILEDPIDYSKILNKFDKFILFENFIENNPEAEIMNAFDIGKKFFEGLERGPMESIITPNKPKGDKIHYLIFWNTSTAIRDLSPAIVFDLLHTLNPDTSRVTLICPPNQEPNLMEIANSLKPFNPKLELRKYVNRDFGKVIKHILLDDTPHIGIGPDTGILNILGYHGIPIIGIYGPFDSRLRLKYYKHAIGIDPVTKCIFGKNEMGSCFSHDSSSCELSRFKDELYSPCIHRINADHIAQAAQFLIKEVYNK